MTRPSVSDVMNIDFLTIFHFSRKCHFVILTKNVKIVILSLLTKMPFSWNVNKTTPNVTKSVQNDMIWTKISPKWHDFNVLRPFWDHIYVQIAQICSNTGHTVSFWDHKSAQNTRKYRYLPDFVTFDDISSKITPRSPSVHCQNTNRTLIEQIEHRCETSFTLTSVRFDVPYGPHQCSQRHKITKMCQKVTKSWFCDLLRP